MNFPRQIPILFLVLSSMYNTGTAWPVRVSANESCITPLHLLRVKCMYLVLERNINISYINESNSKYLRLSHPPLIEVGETDYVYVDFFKYPTYLPVDSRRLFGNTYLPPFCLRRM